MTAPRTVLVVALAAATAFALGCGSDSSGPIDPGTPAVEGSLSFTGDPTGSFTASGPYGETSPSWAVAHVGGVAIIRGFLATSATRGEGAQVNVEGLSAGTYSIDDGSAHFVFFQSTNNTFTDITDTECWLETGSVTVTSYSSQRIQGTFSGEGFCWDGGEDEDPFTVTGGQFNVPVVN